MLLIEWINYHQTELAALTSLISTVFQLMIGHFSLNSLHVCSCQSLLPSFSQSLQSGVTLFSSLSRQSLLPSCSHSFQSGVASLFSARLALSLSRRYMYLSRKFSWKFRSGGPKFPGPKFRWHTQAKGLRKDHFQDQSSGDIPKGLRKDISLQSLNSI